VNKERRDLLRKAELLGFLFDSHTGSGHLKLRNESGAIYIMSHSPSCRRTALNAVAEMERLAGRKLPLQSKGNRRKSSLN
jgi:hypothetical protein